MRKTTNRNLWQPTWKSHEWHWYTIIWLFWGFSIVSSIFWSRFSLLFIHSFSFRFCFLCFFFPFFWNLEVVDFPQTYDALLKSYQNIAPKQFFKGVVHEPPWSSIVPPKYLSNHCRRFPLTPYRESFRSSLWWETLSKALARSKYTMSNCRPLSRDWPISW